MAVVSADAAPDFVAPWRSPTLTVTYTDLDAPLDPAGFVPAMARGEASIVLRHVSDAVCSNRGKLRGRRHSPSAPVAADMGSA